jgi:sarcosine oxidase delta subunit
MDVNNIATVFCPYCNRTMKSVEQHLNGDPHRGL